MGRTIKWLLSTAGLLFYSAWFSCRYEPDYDRTLLAADGVEFFDCCGCDPVGYRWIQLGGLFIVIGFSLLIATLMVLYTDMRDEDIAHAGGVLPLK